MSQLVTTVLQHHVTTCHGCSTIPRHNLSRLFYNTMSQLVTTVLQYHVTTCHGCSTIPCHNLSRLFYNTSQLVTANLSLLYAIAFSSLIVSQPLSWGKESGQVVLLVLLTKQNRHEQPQHTADFTIVVTRNYRGVPEQEALLHFTSQICETIFAVQACWYQDFLSY